jgi:serine/threonine protein kinase
MSDEPAGPLSLRRASERARRFGKYELVELLGHGGMAEVWRARLRGAAGFRRTVVVKRVLSHLVADAEFVALFVAEAKLSARLTHPNIVQVFELGEVDGDYYLAMEYLHGRDLASVMKSGSAVHPALAAAIAANICRALAYAHDFADDTGRRLRIIHRDVTPANIMLTDGGAVKLLDFGIAKALTEATKTQTATLKGKLGYMAPEQIEGQPFDHRVDLFAAGVVLHEMLTGRRLFAGRSELETLALTSSAEVAPPSSLEANVPAALDRICARALARDPGERYNAAAAMLADLEHVATGPDASPEAIVALVRDHGGAPPGGRVAERSSLSRTLRRGRRWAGLAAVALATGGAVAVALTHTAHHAVAPSTPPRTASLPPPSSTPAPAPTPLTRVRIRVTTSPNGAEVLVDRARRGRTPLVLEVVREARPHELVLMARGYATRTVTFVPTDDMQLNLPLLPVAARARSHAIRDTGLGDLEDPFRRRKR